MKRKNLYLGAVFILSFVIWTVLILTIDVQPIGLKGTKVGFATVNFAIHKLTEVNMGLYNICIGESNPYALGRRF